MFGVCIKRLLDTYSRNETLRSDFVIDAIDFVVIANVLIVANSGCTTSIVAFLAHGCILLCEYAIFGFEAFLVWLVRCDVRIAVSVWLCEVADFEKKKIEKKYDNFNVRNTFHFHFNLSLIQNYNYL